MLHFTSKLYILLVNFSGRASFSLSLRTSALLLYSLPAYRHHSPADSFRMLRGSVLSSGLLHVWGLQSSSSSLRGSKLGKNPFPLLFPGEAPKEG